MWPMRSLVPGEDSSTGNVMGGCKLARYVLEAVVSRCAGCRIWTRTNQQRFVDVKHNQLIIKNSANY
jgi:hypothetical protein